MTLGSPSAASSRSPEHTFAIDVGGFVLRASADLKKAAAFGFEAPEPHRDHLDWTSYARRCLCSNDLK